MLRRKVDVDAIQKGYCWYPSLDRYIWPCCFDTLQLASPPQTLQQHHFKNRSNLSSNEGQSSRKLPLISDLQGRKTVGKDGSPTSPHRSRRGSFAKSLNKKGKIGFLTQQRGVKMNFDPTTCMGKKLEFCPNYKRVKMEFRPNNKG